MPIPDPETEAVRLLCAELRAGAAPDADEMALELKMALAARQTGKLRPAAFWALVAEADGAIDDARRARVQRR